MERFEKSVFVSCPKNLIREITSPADALDYLSEFPMERRDDAFSMLQRLCSRASDGLASSIAAERAFTKWAKRNEVLEDITFPPWIAEHSGHGDTPL